MISNVISMKCAFSRHTVDEFYGNNDDHYVVKKSSIAIDLFKVHISIK